MFVEEDTALELIATENTRRIDRERNRHSLPIEAVIRGFPKLADVSPVYGQIHGPIYRFCKECVRQKRWGAAVLAYPETLQLLGMDVNALWNASAIFPRAMTTPKPFILEQDSQGRSVVSPSYSLVLIAYAGFSENLKKD